MNSHAAEHPQRHPFTPNPVIGIWLMGRAAPIAQNNFQYVQPTVPRRLHVQINEFG
jgi:hypothetical protein